MVPHLANLLVATLGASIILVTGPVVVLTFVYWLLRGLSFSSWDHPWRVSATCAGFLFLGMLFILAGTS